MSPFEPQAGVAPCGFLRPGQRAPWFERTGRAEALKRKADWFTKQGTESSPGVEYPGAMNLLLGSMRPYLFGWMLLAAASFPVMAAEQWRLQSTFAWHDNVTNGERPEDILSALQAEARVETGWQRQLAGGQQVDASVGFRAEAWSRYGGLDRLAPSASFAWSRKFGLGLDAPRLVVGVDGEWRVARESGRGGGAGTAEVALRKRFGELWQTEISHQRERFDARSLAFVQTGQRWSARVERALAGGWSLSLDAAWRKGTVLSYSFPPRKDLLLLGKPITFVDTFDQREPLIAYYFPAETRLAGIELRRDFERAGITFRHEIRKSFHAGPGYENTITSVRLVTRF